MWVSSGELNQRGILAAAGISNAEKRCDSLDHPVRALLEMQRYFEAEHFGGL